MKIGDIASVTRRFDAADMAGFARLAGLDVLPDHVPEPLIGGLFSYLLGVELPGRGTNYLKQDIAFHRSAPLGAALTATVEITRLRPEKNLCDLATACRDADGRLVASGRALVSVRDVAAPMEGPGAAGFRFVRERGDGVPLVLLHGWSAHSGFFAPQSPLPARVIAPDLPGHGADRRPHPPALSDLADALADFLAARDLSGVVLAGWSMGATVALDYIRRHGAGRLKGLAVIDMSPRIANGPGWSLGLRSGLDAAGGERAAASAARDWPAHSARVAAALYARQLAEDHPLRTFAREEMAGNDPAAMAALWRDLAHADHRETVAALDLPVLFVSGGASLLYGPDVADWWVATARNARKAVLARAGHAPHLECSDEFNAVLERFVREVR